MRSPLGLYHPSQEHDACGVGFLVDVQGRRSHEIVRDGITILKNLEHRGAVGGDQKTGDGAGMLVQLPDRMFRNTVEFDLPAEGEYGVGFLFLPTDRGRHDAAVALVDRVITEEGGRCLGWREVPTDESCLGDLARERMPAFRQVFVRYDGVIGDELETRLYVLRKSIENAAWSNGFRLEDFYIASLSAGTVVYKGMFVSESFDSFYPDLSDPAFESAISLVHARYSTNTLPAWYLAQPFRYIAHNGEINTLRRNVNNMKARESTISSETLTDAVARIVPIVREGSSDSAVFDNVFELLVRGGRSLEHSLIMMIPEAFGTRFHMSQDKRAFFEYHAAIMEPWDGPAVVAFSDGTSVGASLDRNGLRPARYVVTRSGRVVLASEAGVLEIPAEEVVEKGRLAPGKILMVDTARGRMLRDNEVKSRISRRKPYRHWLDRNRIELRGLLGVPGPVQVDAEMLPFRQRSFGYSLEDLKLLLAPMVENAQEPVGSMGNDTSLAVLSDRPQLLFNYFKQNFAQVTNPPIDPYRENLVMSLMSFVGTERNLLDETPEHCRQLKLAHPILTNDDISRLKSSHIEGYRVTTVPMLFDPDGDQGILADSVDRLCEQVEHRIDQGYSLVILSDRDVLASRAAIPSLLAMGAVHHHLVRRGKRHRAGIILETGEAREVHHFATLVGFGASGINPYLAFETMIDLQRRGYISADLSHEDMLEHYVTAIKKGLLKIMSKMGISTIRSYRGSQIYEAIGLHDGCIERYFTGTPSTVGGAGIERIEADTIGRHRRAFDRTRTHDTGLESGGLYSHRSGSERHLFSPEAISLLQQSVRTGSYELFTRYTAVVRDSSQSLCTLRSLFTIKGRTPIDIASVESEESIMSRFVTSGMSFGSISKEAHETIAVAMNRLGLRSNSGEGGEDESRFEKPSEGDWANSRIKQIASARFGVTGAYVASADELQIKISQGAKPGEGGQLPGHKVDETIARVRHSTPGVMLISPPPHHDIYSIEDLAQLIFDLKHANPHARVSVKLVSEVGVGTIAAGVAKAKADTVLIAGGDGGTGASPRSSIMHAGSPWEIGLAETQQVLVMNGLRDKVRIQVDGQLKTGRDIVVAALLGAEEFGFATTALVTLGCVMMRKCHLNTCPVGVATQDPRLRKRFAGKPEHLMNFMRFMARETRETLAELGFASIEEIVGQSSRLDVTGALRYYRERGLDFSRILADPDPSGTLPRTCTGEQPVDRSTDIDPTLIELCREAIEKASPVETELAVRNRNRAIGATLSYEITRVWGSSGLPDDTIHARFTGSAGQSFGAFLAPGVTFELAGDANDYFGKALSGGRLVIYPPATAEFDPSQNIITGNVNLFGATSGEAYINGMAGERFAVRNSGATAVVEGVGDHGCEYMTGGRIVILGETGVNFAAGMSGGIAYVLDRNQLFDTRCNLEMVDIEQVSDEADMEFLHTYIRRHLEFTGSPQAEHILSAWESTLPLFVKVMPIDYRIALERIMENESRESEIVDMTEEVFN